MLDVQAGNVVSYKNQAYLLWNINESQKAQLITKEGSKFSGTPSLDKLDKIIASYPIVDYNNTKYIVTKNGNIYSTKTGKNVFQSENMLEIKTKIIEQSTIS